MKAVQLYFESSFFLTTFPSVLLRVNHLYFSGRPLEGLEDEFQASIDAMIGMGIERSKICVQVFVLLVRKLRGGDIADEILSARKTAADAGDLNTRGLTYLGTMELSVFFGEWESAAKDLVEAGDLKSVSTGLFAITRVWFIEGLISIHAAQDATSIWKKRKWKKQAHKAVKQIQGWVQKGAVNLVHNLHLLTAELAAIEGKHKKAEKNYKSAINVATRNGFLQDKALSHELASIYYRKQGNDYWAKYHKERSQEGYSDWGATAKVEQLLQDVE